jgi:hypothetical protein
VPQGGHILESFDCVSATLASTFLPSQVSNVSSLYGSSPLPIHFEFNMPEIVRLHGIEPLDSRSATPPTKLSAIVGGLRSFPIA